MSEDEVKELAHDGLFDGKPILGSLEETHISWVILSRRRAFKIKKPFKLPFLDFSTLRLRKKFCERELELNQRFSHIYLSVLPISKTNHQWNMGGEGRPKDYAVVMRRMNGAKKMDVMLRSSEVRPERIKNLAREIAQFHTTSKKIFTPFDLSLAQDTFNDIDMIHDAVKTFLGQSYVKLISQSKDWSDAFLIRHQYRFQQRIESGFKRDVHGDLHSGNIFLYQKPVLFDCIEFNDQYRQIDTLYEIAFLCMELEFYREKSLADYLLKEYLNLFRCLENQEDESIFTYFKCLRANVRAKVHGLQLRQAHTAEVRKQQTTELKKYLELMRAYVQKNCQ